MGNDAMQVNRQSMRLYIALTRTYKKLLDMDLQNIRGYGLNATEFGVLEFLYNKGSHPLQQIGNHILITSGTITYVIDKLEKKGLITRRSCEKDRRIIYAEITEAGRNKMSEILPIHYATFSEVFAGITPDEMEQTIELLKKISLYSKE